MQPGTPEHAVALEGLCGQLLKAADRSADVVLLQSRQIIALMSCVAALSREMEERCGVDRAELARGVIATLSAEVGEDTDRDLMLRSLLGQAGAVPVADAAPSPALRLIPGGKV